MKIVPDDRLALGVRQFVQCDGETGNLFVPIGPNAGAGVIAREKCLDAAGRLVDRGFQRSLLTDVAFVTVQVAGGVQQIAIEDLPEPAGHGGRVLGPALVGGRMCLEQGLLNKVGWINLGPERPAQLDFCEKSQVFAKSSEVVWIVVLVRAAWHRAFSTWTIDQRSFILMGGFPQSIRAPAMNRVAAVLLGIVAGFCSSEAFAAEPDFERDVFPILKRHCIECHGATAQEGDLRIDARADFLAGGASGPAVVAGKVDESELLRRVTLPADDFEHMPANGESLSEEELSLVREWITSGANWPDDFDGTVHWAYVVPERPALPVVEDIGWPRNPIDRFVLAKLEANGLAPSGEADRGTLLRRVSLDLTGLPPTPAELTAFLEDDSADAYEKVVDRLLVSPSFGERWARPWLDLARYADSHGFQRDDLRSIWPYRDWVIRALNSNMPYDQFTIEQIAGDLLPAATQDQIIATGFHRCTTANVEAGTEPEETRVNQVLDRVNTTGTVWLGSTLECAQCHDHKYDPFSQQDYYSFFAYFNGTEIEAERSNPKAPGSIKFLGGNMSFPDDPDYCEERDELQASLARMERQIERVESIRRRKPVVAEKFPSEKKETANDDSMKTLRERRDRIARRLKNLKPPSTLVMKALETPRDTFIFAKGVYTNPTEQVVAATPALFPAASGPPNRLTLAKWLVSRENPLAARVAVNRWWLEIFGRGLVTTPEDFGLKGAPPTHPDLLDWLAVEFMDAGWDRKHILRTIVTSATYRQASSVTPELLDRDPDNALYARGARFRLDAEAIRDQALAIAGLLSHKQFGEPIRPWQPEGLWAKVGGAAADKNYVVSPGEDAYRRGVYVVIKRASPYPSFTTFDATARLTCAVERSRSNTPLQALVLLNDGVYVEAAFAFARRILMEQPQSSLDDRLVYAMRLCLCREPSSRELAILRNLYDKQYEAASADVRRTKTLLKETSVPDSATPTELAAWYAVATTLLNLDETITKE